MPANLDDPASPTIYRTSGPPPYPGPGTALPVDILPRQVTLRDRQTVATIVPFASRDQLPASLGVYLCDQLNKEIDVGDTYPMIERFTPDGFTKYWFQNFGAVMLLGEIDGAKEVVEGKDWAKECLGSFYIKPNYPGRSSHVCNAGFLVTDASRNRGVGRLMGEAYIDWAPRLGYTYSVFNLVYETNVASCRIWDALGFKRIGRVKGCGNLRGYPGRLVDAIIYGRDLAPGESEELVSEERFDKIKYYLKYGKYPNGADRAEKSRLRSAATHYKLTEGDKLMLKDKEVISDPARQYAIATEVHVQQHAGINRTTATIAEKYHWSRIKEMVSDVIRNCDECKDAGKAVAASHAAHRNVVMAQLRAAAEKDTSEQMTAEENNDLDESMLLMSALSRSSNDGGDTGYNDTDLSGLDSATETTLQNNPMLQDQPLNTFASPPAYDQQQPIDPQIITTSRTPRVGNEEHTFEQYHFQALLNATEEEDVLVHQHDGGRRSEDVAVDRDLEMLIEEHDEGPARQEGTEKGYDRHFGGAG